MDQKTDLVEKYWKPPSFEEIGIKDRFDFKHQSGNVRHTDLINLGGIKGGVDESFSVVAWQAPIVRKGTGRDVGLVLFSSKYDAIKPIGRIEFRQMDDTFRSPFVSNCYLSSLFDEAGQLPNHLKKVPDTFDLLGVNGFEILPEYKNKKLGGFLWALGCGLMETLGALEVEIKGDLTQNKKESGRGFYDRYGAQMYVLNQITESGRPRQYKRRYSLAHLLPEQVVMVAEAFDIDLLKIRS